MVFRWELFGYREKNYGDKNDVKPQKQDSPIQIQTREYEDDRSLEKCMGLVCSLQRELTLDTELGFPGCQTERQKFLLFKQASSCVTTSLTHQHTIQHTRAHHTQKLCAQHTHTHTEREKEREREIATAHLSVSSFHLFVFLLP